jgi:hypothetical protein
LLTTAQVDLQLSRAAALLSGSLDLLAQRVWDGAAGDALARRSWIEPLLELSDVELAQLEEQGTEAQAMRALPQSLVMFGASAREVCTVEKFFGASTGFKPKHVKQRKASQIEAFRRVLESVLPNTERVIDVGSGHGHLTRELASIQPKPVLGLERNRALTDRARSLSQHQNLSFHTVDVLGTELKIHPGDCLVGLHACGELGDRITKYAATYGASMALVGCCLQKQRAPERIPLWAPLAPLALPRTLLGLSNLSVAAQGVEASRAENLAARERRIALHWLLQKYTGSLKFGAELEGLNRRSAHAELENLVALAFEFRGLRCPSVDEINDSALLAKRMHGRARRLAIPRSFLARVLEIFVLLDRARFLCDGGFRVQLGELWHSEISPRNLVLLATRPEP